MTLMMRLEKMLSPRPMKDGVVRGSGFANASGAILGRTLGELTLEEVKDRCESLGARNIDSKADFSTVIPLFPRFPILLNLWFADEEFDGTARLLVDESADHYLSIEDAVTAGELIVQKLQNSENSA